MKVIVSRFWHHPEIHLNVTDELISVAMPLDDFIRALVSEAGSPALVMTAAQLQNKLEIAAQKVVSGMKKETSA